MKKNVVLAAMVITLATAVITTVNMDTVSMDADAYNTVMDFGDLGCESLVNKEN